MLQLAEIVKHINDAGINNIAKDVLNRVDREYLPLQQGLSLSSAVSPAPVNIMILKLEQDNDNILIKAGIFYSGIIAGCSCADDPSPQDEQNEYCEVLFTISKSTAQTSIELINN